MYHFVMLLLRLNIKLKTLSSHAKKHREAEELPAPGCGLSLEFVLMHQYEHVYHLTTSPL